MPSKDTIPFRITIKTSDEIDRVRKIISEELEMPIGDITKKQAEIAFRLKAKRGKVMVEELRDILLGKIK